MKKFKLTEEQTTLPNGVVVYRIEALKDFASIKEGEKGGWIEKENNLSQNGDCWVRENAEIRENAEVYENALVRGYAVVYDNAEVSGYAEIRENAEVYENALVRGSAVVCGSAEVSGYARVSDNALVCGSAEVRGSAEVSGYAEIRENADYFFCINNISSGRNITYTKSNGMWKTGCFYGTGEELIKKAGNDSEEKGKWFEKIVNFIENK